MLNLEQTNDYHRILSAPFRTVLVQNRHHPGLSSYKKSGLAGSGWLWLALACSGSGWFWLALIGSGWLWLALAGSGSGWLWLALAGSGWLWLAQAGPSSDPRAMTKIPCDRPDT